MNLKEAYATLEIPQGTSPEEAKKKYRELTKKYHPDINKAPEAEAKFKKINEAYQCVQNGKGTDRQQHPPQRYQYQRAIESIEISLTIDFKESVLGCKKGVKYARQAKCLDCAGQGEVAQNNGCAKCGGKGNVTIQQRGMVFISTCPDCMGKTSTIECTACKGEGLMHTDVSVDVSVPPGVLNGNILRLQGMGNYAGSVMGLVDQYTDVFCHIKVTPEPGLSIEGKSVVCTVTIPLLDAVRGCSRTVNTIFGERRIKIKPESRNKDEVIIPHHGVAGTGDQRVILDVQYPKDTAKLLIALTPEDEEI